MTIIRINSKNCGLTVLFELIRKILVHSFRYLLGGTIVGLSLLFYIFFAQNVANENNFGETYENFERSQKNDIIFLSRKEKIQKNGSTNLTTKNNVAILTKPVQSPENDVILFQINHGTYDWI